jgi:hypothetical protein
LVGEGSKEKPAAKVPLGSSRAVRFLTDAEDQYFDRTKDPGDLKISILSFQTNNTTGGNHQGDPKHLSDLLSIQKSSPKEGKIRISFAPNKDLQVDDLIQIKAILDGPGIEFEERFWIKIVDKENPHEKTSKSAEREQPSLGLPQYRLVYLVKKEGTDFLTWDELGATSGISMDHSTVMHPFVEGDRLNTIFINMDSHVLKTYKSKIRTEDQLQTADKKYVSSVYFHTLFLFAIIKKRQYLVQFDGKEIDVEDFLKGIFESYYSEFLLNFGIEQLIASLDI